MTDPETVDADSKKPELPPYPCGILEWTEDQKKFWCYSDDDENINKRVSFKLWNVWLAWVDLRNDEKLIEIVAKKSGKDTDTFYLKQKLVGMIDRLGKVLGNTNLTEEIVKNAN